MDKMAVGFMGALLRAGGLLGAGYLGSKYLSSPAQASGVTSNRVPFVMPELGGVVEGMPDWTNDDSLDNSLPRRITTEGNEQTVHDIDTIRRVLGMKSFGRGPVYSDSNPKYRSTQQGQAIDRGDLWIK